SAASAVFSVTLNKANQGAVIVTAPSSITYVNTGTAAASGGNGSGAVSFEAGTSTACSLSGTTVSVIDTTLACSLTATKAADNNYNASAARSAFCGKLYNDGFIHFVLPAEDHGVSVDPFKVEMNAINQFLFGFDADTAQHASSHFAEHGFHNIEP